jgi:hypothetical protein
VPAQIQIAQRVTYVQEDTTLRWRRCLKDGAGNPIDLTGSTVVIAIAWSMPHGSYYYSPRDRIVDDDPCVVDPDQINNTGFVEWFPGQPDSDTALTPPGSFLYTFEITYQSGETQIIPENTYMPLIIRGRVGGRAFNP